MATVNQTPAALSLAGNLKTFKISSTESVQFRLLKGGVELLSQRYEPGADGVLEIDVKAVVFASLAYAINSANSYVQSAIAADFVGEVDGASFAFRAVRGGVANLADTDSNWLRNHFLTWQPKIKPVTYYSPEWLTYYGVQEATIKLLATFDGGATQTLTLASVAAGTAVTVNVQYASIAGRLGNVYPTHYKVWAESTAGARLTDEQFYTYSEPLSDDEQWYLFENSLGGLDTFRAYGVNNFDGTHTHQIAEFGETYKEYDVEAERVYNKNTGYLNEYARVWMLDFFPSRDKYIYEDNAIRKIVVTDSDVKCVSSDLPSAYSFSYKFADKTRYLNLIRNESELPANLVVPNLDAPDFIFPPRLSELPRILLTEGVLIPAFDPNSPTATVTTFGEIKQVIVEAALAAIPSTGGPGTGTLVVIMKSTDETSEPSDSTVFTSKKAMIEIAKAVANATGAISGNYLRKDAPDTATELITFQKGIKIGEAFFTWDAESGSLKISESIYSTGEVSAYGAGAGTGGAVGSLGGLANVGLWADEVPASDRIMVQLAGATHWSSMLLSEIVGLDTNALANYLTTNNYVTKNYVTEEISKLNIHTHENKTLLDLITQGNIDVLSHLSIVDGRLKADVDFYSTGEVSAYGAGTGTGGGAVGSLGGLANVGLWADEVPASDRIMVQLAGATHWSSMLLSEIVGLDTVALNTYLTTNNYATQSYVSTKIAELVGTAPTTLDTLNELAAALGNDPNFATSMSTLIGTKWTQDNTKIANWDSAYSALHSHANKFVLDGITADLVTNWNLAYTNNHTHPNKSIIDSLTQANLDVLAKLSIVDGNLKVDTNLWSTGEVSAYGAGSGTGGGGTGLITSVLGSAGLGGSYLDSDLTNTFNAYAINLINTNLTSALGRIGALETSTPNVSWGTPTSQYSPLTINSVTRNLSLDGHTHNYMPISGGNFTDPITVLGNTVWHAGNDGAGSGLDADTIDGLHSSSFFKVVLNNSTSVNDYTFWENSAGKLYGAPGAPYDYYSFLSFGQGMYQTQFNGYNNSLKFRSGDEYGLTNKSWRTVAFEDSNVASATKLATTRTIWGQSFDGAGNVDGVFRSLVDPSVSGTPVFKILRYPSSPYGLVVCGYDSGEFSLQSQRETTSSEYFSLSINPLGGNVGIGMNSPSFKLDVNGAGRATRFVSGYDSGADNSFSCSNWFRSNGATGWYNDTYGAGICSDTTNVVRIYGGSKFKVYNTEADSIYTLGGLKADQTSTFKGISVTNGSYAKGISIGFNSHMQIDGIVASYTYTLPATIGWYRVAVSPSGVERPFGQFDISWTLSSYHGVVSLTSGTMFASAPYVSQSAYTNFGVCITKSRIVYHPSYPGNYAYLEIYNETGKAVSLTVRGYNLTGWTLYSASTVGSIPSGYSNKEISHTEGYMTSGNVAALGEITAYSASDIRLKTEVVSLTNSLQIIQALNPVSYKWNSLAKELNPLKDNNTDYGLIAQELETVMPELVHTVYGQYKSVDYVKIIPHLICAIKQLKMEIDNLKKTYY